MKTPPGSAEPVISTWNVVNLEGLAGGLPRPAAARTRIVVVDGRSGSGKSTLAGKLHKSVPDSAVVHTDDVAWNFSMFDWAGELTDHIILPARAGQPVQYQPPGWLSHGRIGAIDISSDLGTLIIEGVGAGRREFAGLVDTLIWVQSDCDTARDLAIARDVSTGVNGDLEQASAFWNEWMAAEMPFLEEDRPWSRADLVAAGTGTGVVVGEEQVAIGR